MRALQALLRAPAAVAVLLATAPVAGCFDDRPRPSPVQTAEPALLSVQLTAPRPGLTVATGSDVVISVTARDLYGRALTGAGFVVERAGGGQPALDSAVIRFAARGDTVHEFTFLVPDLATNTQIDVYGLAFGGTSQTRRSEPSSLVVVRCTDGVCR